MKSVSFSITQVNRLRSAAVEARTLLAERPDPWPVRDADDLIRVFDTLWLKAGFALHAYDSGGSARGIIWAVPADAPLVAPGEWSRLEDTWLPQPPEAVPLMQTIEGDGSPWSYLSASILRREARNSGRGGPAWSGPTRRFSPSPRSRPTTRMCRTTSGNQPATHPSATGRGAAPLLAYGSRPMPRGGRPGRSSCTSIIRSMETRFTEPRTPIPLVATIARPGPRCCARARGVSTTDRCPRKLRAMNAADPEQAHGSSGMRLRSGRRRSGSHGCDSDEKPTTCAVLERA